jgi:RNA polymerase sigma-70 factor (ECF subfamily)
MARLLALRRPSPARDGADDVNAEVLARFAAGDEAAFDLVYDRYAGPMYSLALGVIGRQDLAADVVQQAFLQAWRNAASVRPDAPIAPWLFTITRRCAIDTWRREQRLQAVDPASAAFDVSDEPADLEARWEAWQVRRALDTLPEEERILVKLVYVDGLSHSDIADKMQLPLGTVKGRIRRTHIRLADRLAHLSPEAGGAT